MTITASTISEKFNEFNKTYFDGSLPRPDSFIVTRAKSYLGQFGWKGKYGNPTSVSKISVSIFYDLNELEFESIVIHEMIHLWQWVNNCADMKHGVDFKKMASKINKMNNFKYNISRCTDLSTKTQEHINPKVTKTDKSSVYMGLYRQNGKDMFAIIGNLKNAQEINKWMTEQYPSLKFRYIKIKYTPEIEKYHKSVKRIHGYPMSMSYGWSIGYPVDAL